MKSNKALRLFLMFVGVIVINSRVFGQQGSVDTVLTWNDFAIKTASANNSRGLLMVRALAIMHTAMLDAWAQYDATAVPTLGDSARRPGAERTWRISEKRPVMRHFGFSLTCFQEIRWSSIGI